MIGHASVRRWRRATRKGQALVETSLILMVLLVIVLGTFEIGFAMDHHITLEYATREGARTGSALANGGNSLDCNDVDPHVVAAVQRVLTADGSVVAVEEVSQIRIYRAGPDGQELGPVNVWVPGAGPEVDGENLAFTQASATWSACGRNNVEPNADSIGVSISYTYRVQTAFSAIFGWATIGMQDRTVMRLNPTGV